MIFGPLLQGGFHSNHFVRWRGRTHSQTSPTSPGLATTPSRTIKRSFTGHGTPLPCKGKLSFLIFNDLNNLRACWSCIIVITCKTDSDTIRLCESVSLAPIYAQSTRSGQGEKANTTHNTTSSKVDFALLGSFGWAGAPPKSRTSKALRSSELSTISDTMEGTLVKGYQWRAH